MSLQLIDYFRLSYSKVDVTINFSLSFLGLLNSYSSSTVCAYHVQFVRFWTSNNGEPLKFG